MSAPNSSGISSGNTTTFRAGANINSANADEISLSTPITRRRGHNCSVPAAHCGHSPHPITGFTVATRPGRNASSVTAESTATIRPTVSCPMT
jgi:hypothetical protein